jgi:hypothetical protein
MVIAERLYLHNILKEYLSNIPNILSLILPQRTSIKD